MRSAMNWPEEVQNPQCHAGLAAHVVLVISGHFSKKRLFCQINDWLKASIALSLCLDDRLYRIAVTMHCPTALVRQRRAYSPSCAFALERIDCISLTLLFVLQPFMGVWLSVFKKE